MRKLLIVAVAAAPMLLSVLPMTAASAATHAVLTISRVGGPNVKVGALLVGNLKKGTKATFFSPGHPPTIVSCSSVSFTDKVVKNPNRRGTAIESLTKQTFKKCSISGIVGATVKSVVLTKLPYKTTISDSKGNPVTVFGTQSTLTIKQIFTIICKYTAKTTKGSANNVGQVISFKNQPFKLTSGSGACPKTGSFSATFGPVRDTSVKGSPAVFVN